MRFRIEFLNFLNSNFQIINTLDEKEEKKISIKKVKWDENPIGYHETGVGVDQVEVHISQIHFSEKSREISFRYQHRVQEVALLRL